jgi:hypothetical protein
VHPLLNCRPTITVGETFHLIQNAGQELGAIDSDLAKRGRRVVLRRLCGVAPVCMREVANPRTIPFSQFVWRAAPPHGIGPSRPLAATYRAVGGHNLPGLARIATSGTPRDVAARRRGAVGESEASQDRGSPRLRPSCRTCCAHDQTDSDSDGGRHRLQRALHRGWRHRLPAGLCARLRGHRVEAPGLAVPLGTHRLLGEGQEPGCARSHARGRGGVELGSIHVGA